MWYQGPLAVHIRRVPQQVVEYSVQHVVPGAACRTHSSSATASSGEQRVSLLQEDQDGQPGGYDDNPRTGGGDRALAPRSLHRHDTDTGEQHGAADAGTCAGDPGTRAGAAAGGAGDRGGDGALQERDGFFFPEGYTDPAHEALLVYYRPGRPVTSERGLVLDRMRRTRRGGRIISTTMAVESFLSGGLIIRYHDQERMRDAERELSSLFQVIRLPGRDGVPGMNTGAVRGATETRETPRRLRNRAVNTDLVLATQPATSDATTEVGHDALWRRDCATSVEEDAPWRSEAAVQAQPASTSIEQQTSMCAPQDRERSQALAPTDAAADSQEKEEDGDAAEPSATLESPGREERHQDEASSPAEKTRPGRRRRRRRTTKQKATPAHQERADQPQPKTAPRTAVNRGSNQERTSAGSGSQAVTVMVSGVFHLALQRKMKPESPVAFAKSALLA
ncbi:uncharacterized protein [Anabrus simplex]|uniref:uncharacterized protein n=1 Tax=Anabrus simplex TaxID=316456 RepID=UPI0035A27DB0